MPLLKVGKTAGKASSTVAESIHEAEGYTAAAPLAHDETVEDSTAVEAAAPAPIKAEYGQQIPGTTQYWTQSMNGQPHSPRIQLEALHPVRSGFVTPVPLPFDIYGTGPIKIMFLTGLGLSRASWAPQLEFFARKPEYSCLVLDNRGFDDLEAAIPLKIAGIKHIARDMKRALEDLGWNKPRSVHILGFSMGGMVALQMGRVCPEYIASMHLVATAAKYKQPPKKVANLVNSLHLLKHTGGEDKAEKLLELLFTPEYLYSHNPDYPEFKHNRERFLHKENIPMLFSKKQNLLNHYSQTLACARHSMSASNLWEVAAKVRFLFVSGADQDYLLHPDCSKDLMTGLNCQGRIYSGGHMIPWQYADELNADQEAMIQRAETEYEEYPPAELLCSTAAELEPVVVAV